jgi:DNA-3-methyladenine glycosylase II
VLTDLHKPLTPATLVQAVDLVKHQDPLLLQLAGEYGMPPLWRRTQSFATLVHIVLEQKVSLTSARAVLKRVQLLCPDMRADSFLNTSEAQLRKAGVSERKVSYCRSIATAIVHDELNLAALRRCSDQQVLAQLTAVRGIGPWTAGVYLLMAMRRPDAWASGDRALAVSLAESAAMVEIPTYAQLDDHAQRWRPYRGAAARLLWHAYLTRRAG